MDKGTNGKTITVRPFTAESLENIHKRIAVEAEEKLRQAAEEKLREAEAAEQEPSSQTYDIKGAFVAIGARAAATAATKQKAGSKAAHEAAAAAVAKAGRPKVKKRPNQALVAGKQFPDKLGEFPPELYGRPVEDLDEFYHNKFVCIYIYIYIYIYICSKIVLLYYCRPLEACGTVDIFKYVIL